MTAFQFGTIKYRGTTPGADANTYVIFATTLPAAPTNAMDAEWSESSPAGMGFRKVALTVKCNNAGTLNLYESTDRGANWRQIDTVAVAAPAASAAFLCDFLVEGLRDFKIEWVNGGAAQSPFDVLLAFSEQRASPL